MGKISVETDEVFRVSLPGKGVDSTVPEDFAVHSGFDYPKIEEHLEGYDLVTAPNTIPTGDTVLLTIDHNYGYIPHWMVYLDDIDNVYVTEFSRLPFTESVPVYWQYYVVPSTTQLKICIYNSGAFGNIVAPDAPAGKRVGIKWQCWVND